MPRAQASIDAAHANLQAIEWSQDRNPGAPSLPIAKQRAATFVGSTVKCTADRSSWLSCMHAMVAPLTRMARKKWWHAYHGAWRDRIHDPLHALGAPTGDPSSERSDSSTIPAAALHITNGAQNDPTAGPILPQMRPGFVCPGGLGTTNNGERFPGRYTIGASTTKHSQKRLPIRAPGRSKARLHREKNSAT